jgi:hypothetical protein
MSFIEKTVAELRSIRSVFDVCSTGITIEKCVELAYSKFYYLYRDTILSLVSVARWS